MTRNRLLVLAIVSVAGVACTAILTIAGPLDPPAGAVGSTHKTLTEVEPRTAISSANTPGDADSVFRITQPGSYYLTANVSGQIARHGIEIAASGVSVDLNGFALIGVNGSLDGVNVSVIARDSILVRNGSIRSFSGDGVDAASLSARSCAFEGLRVAGCGGRGIAGGEASRVADCEVLSSVGNGIELGAAGVVAGCVARDNSFGIIVGAGSSITDSVAIANAADGIRAGDWSIVSRCAADSNDSGIIASRTTISDCAAGQNTLYGIFGASILVARCTVAENQFGISANSNSLIEGCLAERNTGDGIGVAGPCVVRNNICSLNGMGAGSGAGVRASSDARIEGNLCSGADFGIVAAGSNNVILRNTCADNATNWSLAANNVFGAIVDRTAPGVPGFSGNSAAGSVGSTDPNANITY